VKPDAPVRSLLPHEHGAYGQIAVPIVTGLSLGRPGSGALLLGIGAMAAFLSYEALLVATGRRGARAREEHGRRARRVAGGWLSAAALFGGAGFALAPPVARAGALLPPLLAAVVAALAARGWERTVAGEIVVAAALSSAGLPVALASGASVDAAVTSWAAWALGFACATVAVEVVLRRGRRAPGPLERFGAGLPVAILAASAVAWRAGLASRALPLGVAPLALSSLVVILAGTTPRRLKAVGWAALAASLATAAVLVATLR
jgi:hypothetical protein